MYPDYISNPVLHFIVNTLVQYIEMAMANNCNNNKKTLQYRPAIQAKLFFKNDLQ